MTSLYEVLKAQKIGAQIAPDYFTALWAGYTGGGSWEVIEYTGAVPVTIYANGEPLIDWTVKGNMNQQINLFCASATQAGTGNLIIETEKDSSVLHITKDETEANVSANFSVLINLNPGSYYFKTNGIKGNDYIYFKDSGNNIVLNGLRDTNSKILTLEEATTITMGVVVAYANSTYDDEAASIMLNKGSTALPYVPYTPSPSAPVYPQETGDKTANLWRNLSDYSGNGVTIRSEKDGLYFSGTCNSSANVTVNAPLAAGTYTLKANANRIPADDTNACVQIYWNTSNIPTVQNRQAIAGSSYFTVASDVESVQYRIRLQSGVNYDGFILRPVLNIGGSAKPFEPYGYKLDISCGGTTTPVYLGQVETVRYIKKLVLTGEEDNWTKSNTYQGSFWLYGVTDLLKTSCICSHAVYVDTISRSTYFYGNIGIDGNEGSRNINLFIGQSSWSLNDFKTYLQQQYAAGTPVTVWYVLAEPVTGVLNEPLRKIGDYSDSVSAQDGVSIPTAAGENTFDVLTTLKPSEVYIKYKGRSS